MGFRRPMVPMANQSSKALPYSLKSVKLISLLPQPESGPA